MTKERQLPRLNWEQPLTRRVTVAPEMGETTPFVFRDRLYRVENWQKYFDVPGSAPGEYFMGDQVRIWCPFTNIQRSVGTHNCVHSPTFDVP